MMIVYRNAMKRFLSWTMVICLFVFTGCKSVQLDSGAIVADGTIDMTNPSSMNRDAIRILGKVERVNESVGKQGSFNVLVEKIVKYGATFSSVEPKVGDLVTLTVSVDVSFKKGDVILMDVLTPRIDNGEKPMTVRMGQP